MRFCAKRMGQDHRTALQTSKCNHSHSQTNSMNCRYFIILHPNQLLGNTLSKHLAKFPLGLKCFLVQRTPILPFLSETSSSFATSRGDLLENPKFQANLRRQNHHPKPSFKSYESYESSIIIPSESTNKTLSQQCHLFKAPSFSLQPCPTCTQ